MENAYEVMCQEVEPPSAAVFVGPPRSSFTLLGKEFKYVSFSNGLQCPETGVAPYVGLDLPNAEEALRDATVESIEHYAASLKCSTYVFRAGAFGALRRYEAFLDHDGCYHPGGYHYTARVAFVV